MKRKASEDIDQPQSKALKTSVSGNARLSGARVREQTKDSKTTEPQSQTNGARCQNSHEEQRLVQDGSDQERPSAVNEDGDEMAVETGQRGGQYTRPLHSETKRGIDQASTRGSQTFSHAKNHGSVQSQAQFLLHGIILAVEYRRIRTAEQSFLEGLQARRLDSHESYALMADIEESKQKLHTLDQKTDRLNAQLVEFASVPLVENQAILKHLPRSIFERLTKAARCQQETEKQKSSLPSRDKATAAMDAVKKVIIHQTKLRLNARGLELPAKEAQGLEDQFGQAWSEFHSVHADLGRLASKVKASEHQYASLIEQALDDAEAALARTGPLTAPVPVSRKTTNSHHQDRQNNGNHSRTDKLSASQELLALLRPGPSRPEPFGQPDDRHLDLRMQLRRWQDYCQAKHAWSEASAEFHKVRENYRDGYEAFKQARARGEEMASKTVFDANYYLARKDANHRLVLAMAEARRTRKVAQMVGALFPDQITSDFADHSSDGYAPSGVAEYQRLIDHERVQHWCERLNKYELTENLAEPVLDIALLPQLQRSGTRSIAEASSHSQMRYAEDKRREVIDSWQADQEELRLRMIAYRREKEALQTASDRPFRAFCGVALPTRSTPFRAFCGVAVAV